MKVLIAIDNSNCSHHAIESILKRPWFKDTEFRVIHVVEPIVSQYSLVAPQAISLMVNAERILKAEATKFTNAAAEKIKNSLGIEKVSTKVLEGFVADTIIEQAGSWQADLLVVGSHGRTGMDKLLLGSVAEKLVNHAPCSVDVIKASQSSAEAVQTAGAQEKTLVSQG